MVAKSVIKRLPSRHFAGFKVDTLQVSKYPSQVSKYPLCGSDGGSPISNHVLFVLFVFSPLPSRHRLFTSPAYLPISLPSWPFFALSVAYLDLLSCAVKPCALESLYKCVLKSHDFGSRGHTDHCWAYTRTHKYHTLMRPTTKPTSAESRLETLVRDGFTWLEECILSIIRFALFILDLPRRVLPTLLHVAAFTTVLPPLLAISIAAGLFVVNLIPEGWEANLWMQYG